MLNAWKRIPSGLISKIYEEFTRLHFRKTNTPIKNRQKTGTLLQGGHTERPETYEKCSVSLAIRDMQIKTTMRYHFTLERMAIINKATNNKCWRRCGEKGTLVHCWWECRLVQPLWKTVEFPQRTKYGTAFGTAIPLLFGVVYGSI